MTYNKYIEEDFERMKYLDQMWSVEEQKRIEDECWEWVEEIERQRKLPAVIYVDKSIKIKQNENKHI